MPDQDDRDALPGDPTEPYTPTFTTGELEAQPEPEPPPVPDEPVAVPGANQYLKRWTFVLMVGAVWIVAVAIGLGLYYWWYHSLDKTPAVFMVLVFLVVCAVGGLLAAMVPNKPLMSALAIGLISAPFAATAGASVLHGLYFCDYASRCLVGLIPY